jgi:hypothetical protein
MFIVLLVIVTVMAMATTALAGRPADKPGKPEPPDIWTCAARVDNGAVWVPGTWNDTFYVSEFDPEEDVGVPLCIDLDKVAAHKHVTNWSVRWEGKAVRKAPKGMMFIFEEEVHATHYAEAEALPDPEEEVFLDCVFDDETGEYTCDGSWENIILTGNGDAEHLVFLAMGHQGDKWTNITFWVTPNP